MLIQNLIIYVNVMILYFEFYSSNYELIYILIFYKDIFSNFNH